MHYDCNLPKNCNIQISSNMCYQVYYKINETAKHLTLFLLQSLTLQSYQYLFSMLLMITKPLNSKLQAYIHMSMKLTFICKTDF